MTVSDGDDSAMATGSVTVRDINGTWRDPGLFGGATLTLTQNGTSVTGTYRDVDGPGSVAGTLQGNNQLRMTINQPPFAIQNITGTINDDVSVISGGGFFGERFQFRRQ